MNIEKVHNFDINSEDEFSKIQNSLVPKIKLKNLFLLNEIKLCAGVDLAYWKKDDVEYGVCCIVVIDFETQEVVEKVDSFGVISHKYIPGFLAFRELPLVIKAAEKLYNIPDIFIFDGNGYLHYNHMGIATHASFFLNKPTIGVAKSYLKIENVEYSIPENTVGSYNDLIINNETYGRVLRSRKDVKPIFLSCGNYIDLDTSMNIVMHFVGDKSRLPIPVQYADIETHKMRDIYSNKN